MFGNLENDKEIKAISSIYSQEYNDSQYKKITNFDKPLKSAQKAIEQLKIIT